MHELSICTSIAHGSPPTAVNTWQKRVPDKVACTAARMPSALPCACAPARDRYQRAVVVSMPVVGTPINQPSHGSQPAGAVAGLTGSEVPVADVSGSASSMNFSTALVASPIAAR